MDGVPAFNAGGAGMSLLAIRDYLIKNKAASLKALSQHFQCDIELLRQMMRHWIQKGCVRCFTRTPLCGSRCGQCPLAEVELYEWLIPQ